MASADYSAFNALVAADYSSNAHTAVSLLSVANYSGAYAAYDLANRDNVILGNAPVWFATNYPFPPNLAGIAPLQIPSNIAVPPLSPAQLALIAIQPAPPPVVTPPVTTPTGGSTSSGSTSSGSPSGSTPATGGAGPKPAEFLGPPDPGGAAGYCDLYPNDPLCGIWTGTGPIVLGGGGGVGINENVNISIVEGINAVDVDAIVDGSLNGLWRAAVDAVDAAVADVVQDIQGALTGIANALKAAYNALARLAGFILNMLGTLWNDIVKGIVAALHAVADVLKDLYNDILKPLAQAMQDVRNWLLKLYRNWLRPLLIILQDLRQVLAILKLFHLKFATKLDAAIADIQTRILQPILWLLSFTNAIANWVNLIVTANYLIQQPLFLWSLKAYVGGAINLQVNAMNPGVDPGALTAAQAANSVPSAAQSAADFDQFVTNNSGAFISVFEAYTPVIDSYLQNGPPA